MKRICLLFPVMLLLLTGGPVTAQTTAAALPVSISVTAALTVNNTIVVSWTMLQKLNAIHFTVEKSSDGRIWNAMAVVQAVNEAPVPFTYGITDASPLKASNYYRVRIAEANGNTGISEIKCVRIAAPSKIAVYPNPCSLQGGLNIVLGSAPATAWKVMLINLGGQVLAEQHYGGHTTSAKLPLQGYIPGVYTLVISVEGNTESRLVVLK